MRGDNLHIHTTLKRDPRNRPFYSIIQLRRKLYVCLDLSSLTPPFPPPHRTPTLNMSVHVCATLNKILPYNKYGADDNFRRNKVKIPLRIIACYVCVILLQIDTFN